MKKSRTPVPEKTQLDVLSLSARRCALCYGVDGDFSVKAGQISHLDKDRQNNGLGNLAFLCLRHHDEFDSVKSQSKGYLRSEIVKYRKELHNAVAQKLRQTDITESLAELLEQQNLRIQEAMDRYDRLARAPDLVHAEIMVRIHALCEFAKWDQEHTEAYESNIETDEPWADEDGWDFIISTSKLMGIPFGTNSIPEGSVEIDELIEDSELFFRLWACGHSSPKRCRDYENLVDDYLDLDLGWIIVGIPHTELPPGGYRSLLAYFHKFGIRHYED